MLPTLFPWESEQDLESEDSEPESDSRVVNAGLWNADFVSDIIQSQICDASSVKELLPFAAQLTSLDELKRLLLTNLNAIRDRSELKSDSNERNQNIAKLRSIYLCTASMDTILPSDIITNVLQYLSTKHYAMVPCLSKAFRQLMHTQTILYNSYQMVILDLPLSWPNQSFPDLFNIPLKITIDHNNRLVGIESPCVTTLESISKFMCREKGAIRQFRKFWHAQASVIYEIADSNPIPLFKKDSDGSDRYILPTKVGTDPLDTANVYFPFFAVNQWSINGYSNITTLEPSYDGTFVPYNDLNVTVNGLPKLDQCGFEIESPSPTTQHSHNTNVLKVLDRAAPYIRMLRISDTNDNEWMDRYPTSFPRLFYLHISGIILPKPVQWCNRIRFPNLRYLTLTDFHFVFYKSPSEKSPSPSPSPSDDEDSKNNDESQDWIESLSAEAKQVWDERSSLTHEQFHRALSQLPNEDLMKLIARLTGERQQRQRQKRIKRKTVRNYLAEKYEMINNILKQCTNLIALKFIDDRNIRFETNALLGYTHQSLQRDLTLRRYVEAKKRMEILSLLRRRYVMQSHVDVQSKYIFEYWLADQNATIVLQFPPSLECVYLDGVHPQCTLDFARCHNLIAAKFTNIEPKTVVWPIMTDNSSMDSIIPCVAYNSNTAIETAWSNLFDLSHTKSIQKAMGTTDLNSHRNDNDSDTPILPIRFVYNKKKASDAAHLSALGDLFSTEMPKISTLAEQYQTQTQQNGDTDADNSEEKQTTTDDTATDDDTHGIGPDAISAVKRLARECIEQTSQIEQWKKSDRIGNFVEMLRSVNRDKSRINPMDLFCAPVDSNAKLKENRRFFEHLVAIKFGGDMNAVQRKLDAYNQWFDLNIAEWIANFHD